jgi:hypothetical protein
MMRRGPCSDGAHVGSFESLGIDADVSVEMNVLNPKFSQLTQQVRGYGLGPPWVQRRTAPCQTFRRTLHGSEWGGSHKPILSQPTTQGLLRIPHAIK